MRIKSIIVLSILVSVWLSAQTHFTPVSPTGLPYHVIIQDPTFNGQPLPAGTEIGIYDDTLCVGAVQIAGGTQISVVTWKGNPLFGIRGYKDGDTIRVRLWINIYNQMHEIPAQLNYSIGNGTFGNGSYSVTTLAATSALKPALTIRPKSIDFGNVIVGFSGQATLRLINQGDAELQIQQIVIDNGQFQWSGIAERILPLDSATIQLTYTPSSAIFTRATLRIESNDPLAPVITCSLIGQGKPKDSPVIVVDKRSIDFQNVLVGDVGKEYFSLTNNGTAPLSITSIGISSTDFSVSPGSAQILEGQSTSFEVRFTPTAEYQKNGSLSIYNNGVNENPVSISLQGIGFSGKFSSVKPTGQPYLIIIKNISVDGKILGIGDEVGVFDDTVCVGNTRFNGTLPFSLVAWKSNTQPSLPGYRDGDSIRFKLWSRPYGNWVMLAPSMEWIKGDGRFGTDEFSSVTLNAVSSLEPKLVLSKPLLYVGSSPVGISRIDSIFITNNGMSSLLIDSIVASQSQFTIQPARLTILPSASGVLKVTFRPTQEIPYKAIISWVSNDPLRSRMSYTVEGSGLPAPKSFLEVPSTSMAFSPTSIGDTSIAYLPLINTGTLPVTITASLPPGADYKLPAASVLVQPGSTCQFPVYFIPTKSRSAFSNLVIQTNATNLPSLTVPLSALGYENYFHSVKPTGMPYQVVVNELLHPLDVSPKTGDVIGIFDGILCVGTVVIDTGYFQGKKLSGTAWQENSGQDRPGFHSGNTMTFRYFARVDTAAKIYSARVEMIEGNGKFGTGPYSAMRLVVTSGLEVTASRGIGQRQVILSTLDPFVITAKFEDGTPAQAVQVQFTILTVPSGAVGYSMSDTVAITDSLGEAKTALTLGTKAGKYIVSASLVGLFSRPQEFIAHATAGKASIMLLADGTDQKAVVNTYLIKPLSVFITDIYGNTTTGDTVKFEFTQVPPGAVGYSVSKASVRSDSLGFARANVLLGNKIGTYIIAAVAESLIGSPVMFSAKASADNPARMALHSGNLQKGPILQRLPLPLRIAVTDTNNNPTANTAVNYLISKVPLGSTGFSITAGIALTDSLGLTAVFFTPGTKIGPYTITASAPGLKGSPITYTVTASSGIPREVTSIAGDNQFASIDSVLPEPFVAMVSDTGGNPCPGILMRFSFSSFPSGAVGHKILIDSVLTDSNGIAQTRVQLGNKTGMYYVKAAADGYPSAQRIFSARALAGVPVSVSILSGSGQLAAAGNQLPLPFMVMVKDKIGNPVQDVPVHFKVISSPAGAAGNFLTNTNTTTDSAGQASTFLVPSLVDGNYTVHAVVNGLIGSPIIFTASVEVPRLVLSAAKIVFGDIKIGDSSSFSVTMQNTRRIPVIIQSVFVTHNSFTLHSLPLPDTLQSNQSASVMVTFMPTFFGISEGKLVISTNGLTHQISMEGTSPVPEISADAAIIDFGRVMLNQPATKVFVVSNPSINTLRIDSIRLPSEVFALSGVTFPLQISQGMIARITTAFIPKAETIYADTMYVYNNSILPVLKLIVTGRGVTSMGVMKEGDAVPQVYSLSQNFPNPFNPSTNIRFGIPENASVRIALYDITGREISEIVHQYLSPGYYVYTYQSSNLSSGLYFYRITAISKNAGKDKIYTNVKKLMFMK